MKRPSGEFDALPVGRRARKALAVRQALFDAGLAAFERQPFGLVSVLDITEAADVAKGVFYLQFKSKDDYLLALWGEVQSRFLETVRAAVLDCDSSVERLAGAISQYRSFARSSKAAARFWIRMGSYFPDEVGPPGQLTRIQQQYVRQLASIVSGKDAHKLTAADVRLALTLDSICWAVLGAEAHTGELLFDGSKLVSAVLAAMPSMASERCPKTGHPSRRTR